MTEGRGGFTYNVLPTGSHRDQRQWQSPKGRQLIRKAQRRDRSRRRPARCPSRPPPPPPSLRCRPRLRPSLPSRRRRRPRRCRPRPRRQGREQSHWARASNIFWIFPVLQSTNPTLNKSKSVNCCLRTCLLPERVLRSVYNGLFLMANK